MRILPTNLAANMASGPAYTKDTGPATRLTVQTDWWLTEQSTGLGAFDERNVPIRWWQDDTNSQFADEVEIPNIISVQTDENIQQPAGTLTAVMVNTHTPANGSAGPNSNVFGEPGYYSFAHGTSQDAAVYFNSATNSWQNVLRENALVRMYQGFGGWWLSVQDAVDQGYLILKGVYLLDSAQADSSSGQITLKGRSMAKLGLEQSCWPPTVPPGRYGAQGLVEWVTGQVTDTIPAISGYGHDGEPQVAGFSWAPDGNGYRIFSSDGGVFCYGSSTFWGSMGGRALTGVIVGGDDTPNSGYRLFSSLGGVFDFGDATFLGSLGGDSITDVVAGRNTPSGDGYYMVRSNGAVYAFGDAVYQGGLNGISLPHPIVDMCLTASGNGYWLMSSKGAIYSFGDAVYHGGCNTLPETPVLDSVSMDRTESGNGYWIMVQNGDVYSFGDAVFHGSIGGIPATMCSCIRRSVSGYGYAISSEAGGIFVPEVNSNDAGFYGAMPGDWTINVPGTYADYRDIVEQFALWSGWFLKPTSTGGNVPSGQQPKVYGNLESTGAYNRLGPLNGQVWDKKTTWECMAMIASIVSYLLRVDDQGALRFEPHNFWAPGNFLDDGSHTSYIPVFFDEVNITDYSQTVSGDSLVSDILVGTQDPYLYQGAPNDTAIIRFTPPNISTLHGINKPAMIGIPLNVPVSTEDEEIMAELLAVQCYLALRQGQLTAPYNPAICVDDQIRIIDRSTGEADIHYVTGISVNHDLQSGQCLMTLSTYWLGNSLSWAITSRQNSFLAGSEMTASIYDINGILISEQLVQFLAGTGSVKVSQLVGAPMDYPPELGPIVSL